MKLTPLLKAVLLLMLCAQGTLLKAQPKVPVSPEAAALAKMVNYPVNFNTGIPDISVPLYNLQVGGLTVPFTLSYHAGGFKTNEKATRSGLGWSLSADIQITRTVNGTDDLNGYILDDGIKAFYPNSPPYNYPINLVRAHQFATGQADGMPDKFSYKLLDKSGSFYFIKTNDGNGYGIVPVPFDYLKITYSDGEFTIVDTDGTTYSFGGKGYIDAGNYPQRYTELSGGVRTTFKCKKIVNANRTEQLDFVYQSKAPVRSYAMGHSIEYYSHPNPCSLGSYETYATHSRVKNMHPDLAETYNNLMANYRMYQLSSPHYMEHFPNGNSVFHLPEVNGNTVEDHIYTVPQSNTTSQMIYSLALSQINFRTGSVVLNGTESINSIQVKNANGQEVKTINFYQSTTYPTSNAGFLNQQEFLNNGTRYLDSIAFVANGKRFETYKFQYLNKYCFGEYLQGKDAWGYPNANTVTVNPSNNVMAIRETSITQRFYYTINPGCSDFIDNVVFKIGNSQLGNVEATDETSLNAGLLRRMVYPTGGYVDFEYESNSAEVAVSGGTHLVAMTGGLRVKTISHYDGQSDQPSSYKYYRYGDLEQGTGILINTPYQDYDPVTRTLKPFHYTQKTAYIAGPPNSGYSTSDAFAPIPSGCTGPQCISVKAVEEKTTYLPASANDYTYATGAPIYYTKVTEYNQDFGTMTGKKVYTFLQPNDYGGLGTFFHESKIPETNINVIKTDGLMGQPTSIEDYEYKNGHFSLVHLKTTSYYKYSRPAQVRVIYAFQKLDYSAYEGGNTGPLPDMYAGYNGNYFTNGIHSLDDLFKYGEYGIEVAKLLPSTEMERWYSGPNDFVQNITSYEYSNGTYPQLTKLTTSGKNNQTISKVFKYAYDYPGTAVCDTMRNRNMISQPIEEISYTYDQNGTAIETARTKTVYGAVNQGWHILPAMTMKSAGGAPLDVLVSFDQYGSHENVLQLTEKNHLVKSYLWDSQEVYPVVEVRGANYGDASTAAGSAGIAIDATASSAIKSLGNTIQSALPNSMVSTYAYKPMVGVITTTGPDARSKYFSYDDYGRLLTIRDHDQHILKKHEYVLARTPSRANYYLAYNNPMMLTYSGLCADNIRRMVSVRQPALRYTNPTSSQGANPFAESELNAVWYSIAGGIVDLSRPEANVKLRLNTLSSGGPMPVAVYLDLIQEGHVVVSKRIPYLAPSSTPGEEPYRYEDLYIEPGTYQVAIRYETNYNGSLCRFMINGNTVRTGNTFNFQPSTTYECILFNN